MRYVGITAVVLAAVGCQDELTKYDVSQKGDIYFEYAGITDNNATDSIYVGVLDRGAKVEEMLVEIPVAIMGKVVDYDREIKLASGWRTGIDNMALPDVDFVFEKSVIPAGETRGFARVKFLRTPRLDAAGVKGLHAEFVLMPNEDFNTNYWTVSSPSLLNKSSDEPMNGKSPAVYFGMSAIRFKVNFNNATEQSPLFNPQANLGYSTFSNYFNTADKVNGDWLRVYMDQTGYGYEYWFPDMSATEELGPMAFMKEKIIGYFGERYAAQMPTAPAAQLWQMYGAMLFDQMNGYASLRRINRYLKIYEFTHGEKLKDSEGNVIELGASAARYQ